MVSCNMTWIIRRQLNVTSSDVCPCCCRVVVRNGRDNNFLSRPKNDYEKATDNFGGFACGNSERSTENEAAAEEDVGLG